MEPATLDEIKAKAHELHDNGVKWHFHILTPTCILNEKQSYVFILECPDQNLTIVHYSNQAEKKLGQELSPLLHGSTVLDQGTTDIDYRPSEIVTRIVQRAKSLNRQSIEWHHHVLFPDCRFNKNSPKFTLVFEDPEEGETLESLSNEEPTNDLKQIEGLLYK
ncbi:MAG TPA: hypothetical protein VGF75_04600 [Candidatus Saccharimonadales bacterium]|jgi:hypothetical protein